MTMDKTNKRKSSFPSFLAYTNQLRIKFPFTTTQEEEEEEVQLQHFFRFSWLTPLTSQNLGASITTPISNLISVYSMKPTQKISLEKIFTHFLLTPFKSHLKLNLIMKSLIENPLQNSLKNVITISSPKKIPKERSHPFFQLTPLKSKISSQ
jgi:hypothetical protein